MNSAFTPILNQIKTKFLSAFGRTPFKSRIQDIVYEAMELSNATSLDFDSIKEEAGDLLTSVLQLYNELGIDPETLIGNTLEKIERRMTQYHALGRKYNIALYGGAFDPIHEGHIAIAKSILNSGYFDEVWLMPCYKHMNGKKMASPEHRLKMCEIASKVDARIQVCDYEIKNQFTSDAAYVINRIQNDVEFKDQYRFHYAIGMDNANTIRTWSEGDEIIHRIPFVVFPRVGCNETPDQWYLQYPHIFLKNGDTKNISSTMVRNLLKTPPLDIQRVNLLLSQPIIDYIQTNHLYGVN